MDVSIENDPFAMASGFCAVCRGAFNAQEIVKASAPQMCAVCRPTAYHALIAYIEGKISIENLGESGVKVTKAFLYEDRILVPFGKNIAANPVRPGFAKWVIQNVVDGADMAFVRGLHSAILEKYNHGRVKNVGGFFHRLGEAMGVIKPASPPVDPKEAPEPTPEQIAATLPGGGSNVSEGEGDVTEIPESHEPAPIEVPEHESDKDKKRRRLAAKAGKGKKGAKPSDTPADEKPEESGKVREVGTPRLEIAE